MVFCGPQGSGKTVALRKESVDRNSIMLTRIVTGCVALRKESVDRNEYIQAGTGILNLSLSARRAWIEISPAGCWRDARRGRSPQGERG